jgi:hypothetical protein
MLSRVAMQVEGGCWDEYMLAYIMYILSVSLLHVHIASAEHRRSLLHPTVGECHGLFWALGLVLCDARESAGSAATHRASRASGSHPEPFRSSVRNHCGENFSFA